MLNRLASSPSTRRLLAALVSLVFLTFTASGARIAIPGVRENTRATAPLRVSRFSVMRARVRAQALAGLRNGGGGALRVLRWLVSWAYPHPHLMTLPALVGRAHGADGHHGPRGRRWLVLGGHGRLGPGSRI